MKRSGLLIPRFFHILPTALLTALCTLPVFSDEPKFSEYPLRLVIVHTGGTTESNQTFSGVGQGNLLYANSAQAFDFAYDNCPYRVLSTARDQQFHARWKNEGTDLEVLVPASIPAKPIHTDDNHFTQCVLQVALQDAVYIRQIGVLTTISRQEYEKTLSQRASVEKGLPANMQNQALPSGSSIVLPSGFGSRGIAILPVPNAPFIATILIERREALPDGSARTTAGRQLVARDRSGRVFEEWRSLQPNGDKKQTNLLATEHIDPLKHLFYSCVPGSEICTAFPYDLADTTAAQKVGVAGKTEDLGEMTIDNLNTIGLLKTTPLDAATNGDKEMIHESWFSPQLKINLLEKRSGTPSGNHLKFSVINLHLGEPAPMLFAPPAGYKIVPPSPLPSSK